MSYRYQLGDLIRFKVPFHGSGTVVGCASGPVMGLGSGWILELTEESKKKLNAKPDEYPFTHVVVFDAWVKT